MNASGPAHSLHEELAAARSLVELLRHEESYLVDSDVEGLIRVTEEKARAATLMSGLAKNRYGALAAAGLEAGEPGMQAWLKSADANDDARRLWGDLLDVAKAAKELNRVNGMLISQQMGRNQTALNVLQGGAQGGTFYGPNGQSATKIGSRRLVVG